jgi:hypothetical protein
MRDQIKDLTTQISNCVITKEVNLETCLRSAERTDISTLHKLMPIGG